jgi:DNA-binding SARP family transcriptional activator
MEFCLLGPLLVRSGGSIVPVPRGKQRVVLALLLLKANRVVPVEQLADAVWGASAPPAARVTVQNYIKRLRRDLSDVSRDRIGTKPPGYVMRVDASELDLSRFEVLSRSAREAAKATAWARASAQAREALSMWRGEPLEDVESEMLVAGEAPRLTEIRLQLLELQLEADLHLGRHADVIPELRRLVHANALRENLYAMLMLALYRNGQQGAAFAVYQTARRVLMEELGTEPGVGLRELHQRIMAADPALAVTSPRKSSSSLAVRVVPRELPSAVRHFTGRQHELAALTGMLAKAPAGSPGTAAISAIGGPAGVGKTTLALHWAHRVAGRFPDGQLYVNLRGYDAGQPVGAPGVLAGFLRALGVPGPDIPIEPAERAARYRSLLAGRRMLILLDNASGTDQVRPLLPASGGCVVLVTSRDQLPGLIVRDGAQRLELDVLPLAAAVSLLRKLIGERVDAEPEATAVLAAQCARLPLALRLAAELAAVRPGESIADLINERAACAGPELAAGV